MHTPSLSAGLSAGAMRQKPGRQFVFICGLHRSGTTMITQALSDHPMISGFKNTGAIEDEGQFLQTVFPCETAIGGVGRFGFDPRAHMTESSRLNTEPVASTLLSEWGRYWDLEKPVLMEKTPSNLLRMRLLTELCAPATFIIVTRHPVAACLAAVKWTEGNIFSLLSHWVHCYRIARGDADRVKRCIWMSYEAFVGQPERELGRVCEFLGLAPFAGWNLHVRDDNGKYFGLWKRLYFADGDRTIEQQPPETRKTIARRICDKFAREMKERSLPPYRRRENLRNFHDAQDAVALLEPEVNAFGYSLTDLSRKPR